MPSKIPSPIQECPVDCTSSPIINEPSPVITAPAHYSDNHPSAYQMVRDFFDAISDKPSDLFMWFLLFMLLIFLVGLLWSWHKAKNNNFNLMDAITIDGKLDESKMTRFIAFIISTWGFIFLMITERFTEWYFMGYMAAWVGNALFNRYLRQRDKEIDKTFDLDERALDQGYGKPRNRFDHSGDIEPFGPDSEVMGMAEEEIPEPPPPPRKSRRKG